MVRYLLWSLLFFSLSESWATIYTISPSKIRVEKGGSFTCNVELFDVQDTAASNCYLIFNPDIIQLGTITKGSDSIYSWLAGGIEEGRVDRIKIVTGIEQGGNSSPVSGSGTVATIEFLAFEDGSSGVRFDRERTKIKDIKDKEIFYLSEDGSVLVVPFDHFNLSDISSPQITGSGFNLIITAFDKNGDIKNGFSGSASLSCKSGVISPSTITLTQGVWTGNVVMAQSPNYGTETVIVSCLSVTENSNPFILLNNSSQEAVVKEEGIVLEISENALQEDFVIHIATLTDTPVEIPTSTLRIGDTLLDVNAYTLDGKRLGTESLLAPSTITVSYNDIDQDGWVDGSLIWEEELVIYQYGNGVWSSLFSIVDPIKNTVSAELPHLSFFLLSGTETTGSISTLSADAQEVLALGDTLTVTLLGIQNCRAYFGIEGIGTASMVEKGNGVYCGSYTVKAGDNIKNAEITGYLLVSTATYSMEATRTVTIDTVPPTIKSFTPGSGSYISGTITVEITAEDSVSGLSQVNLYLDNSYLGSSTDHIFNITGCSEGLHHLWCVVYDRVGNCATSSYSITIDNTDPILEMIELTQRFFSNKETITVSFSYTEKNPESAKVKIGGFNQIIPLLSECGTVTLQIPLYSILDGICTLNIEVIDKAGRAKSFSIPIIISSLFGLIKSTEGWSATLTTQFATITARLGTYTGDAYGLLEEKSVVGEIGTNQGIRQALVGIDISLYNTDTTKISAPQIELNLKIAYLNQPLDGIAEDSLRIYWYDGNIWKEIASSVDTTDNILFGTTTHLSLFALAGTSLKKTALDLNSCIVYPNPAKKVDKVRFDSLPQGTKLRIYTISGELVYQKENFGANPVWELKDVSSGVYIYILDDGKDKVIGKVGVIR
ncbi:MAG: T9SS type A sorting domain-containing protein [bacterium]